MGGQLGKQARINRLMDEKASVATDCAAQPMAAPDADLDKRGGEALSKLVLLPTRYVKHIHLVRHGEGFHNVAGHIDHDNYKSEEWYEDACLQV